MFRQWIILQHSLTGFNSITPIGLQQNLHGKNTTKHPTRPILFPMINNTSETLQPPLCHRHSKETDILTEVEFPLLCTANNSTLDILMIDCLIGDPAPSDHTTNLFPYYPMYNIKFRPNHPISPLRWINNWWYK